MPQFMMRIGFVGFGEAGSTIAGGLRLAGVEQFVAYDVNTNNPAYGPRIQERARETQTTLLESPEVLAASADTIFSTVTSSSALDAAKQNAPFLSSRHTYADLNSVSPALKQDIARVIVASGARFVEVAVMAPVQPYGHKVPMLLGGPGAAAFKDAMTPFGMRMEILEGAKV